MITSSVSWGGKFAPRVSKSIGTVRYLPLVRMTPRDWEWLDFDNIRTVARNRIASAAVNGNLYGFFQVMITEKAAKNEYFWPATADDIARFVSDDSADFFGNEAEVDSDSVASEGLERLRAGMLGLPLWVLLLIVKQVANQEIQEELSEQAGQVNEEHLEEMRQQDVELLVSAIMLWYLSLQEAESVIDDLPESDEVDEVRDWINDRFAEIATARRRLAAGRGITP